MTGNCQLPVRVWWYLLQDWHLQSHPVRQGLGFCRSSACRGLGICRRLGVCRGSVCRGGVCRGLNVC